ncbi:hypothetical protein GCWU000324_03060 [Kingella oralis ATCC 51147]|uniref:Uncharacterized protein n=1 Tax=Kingella oralis ATCC 51147 TaxID=629741 RepID=C4GMX4_9NEIS|nr:hypothetical protein GCWU000324_03060 [Kingella oralis ATCC 51147]
MFILVILLQSVFRLPENLCKRVQRFCLVFNCLPLLQGRGCLDLGGLSFMMRCL